MEKRLSFFIQEIIFAKFMMKICLFITKIYDVYFSTMAHIEPAKATGSMISFLYVRASVRASVTQLISETA